VGGEGECRHMGGCGLHARGERLLIADRGGFSWGEKPFDTRGKKRERAPCGEPDLKGGTRGNPSEEGGRKQSPIGKGGNNPYAIGPKGRRVSR